MTDYRYNKLNQLISKTTPEGSFVYEYDKRGNLIVEKQGGTVMYTYEYDASNRMVKGVNVSTDETSEYIYNGLGMRVANVQTTQNASYGARSGDNNGIGGNSGGSVLIGDMNVYALDGRPVGVQRTFMDNFGLTRQSKPAIINREYVVDYTNPYNRDLMVYEEGSYVTSYTYGLGLNRISQTVMNYPNKTEVGIEGQNSYTDLAVEKYEKLYLHQDRLGSTIRMTRENGTTIAWADYDEWGKPRSPIDHDMNMAGVDNAIGFTSYTYDVVLEKFFAQARFYDASNRRFIQGDPIKDGLNWYAYAGNSPVVYCDPTGELSVAFDLLQDAFLVGGKKQDYSSRISFKNTFYESPTMQGIVDEHLREFKEAGVKEKIYTGTVSFYDNPWDLDLQLGVGLGNYSMTITEGTKTIGVLWWKKEVTVYNITITISDRYDFDNYREATSLGSILNNWGCDRQQDGSLVPFEWMLTYTFEMR